MGAIGSRIIKHVLTYPDSYEKVISAGVADDHFMGENKDAFAYIRKGKAAAKMPTVFEVADKFAVDLTHEVEAGDLDHLLTLVKKRHVLQKMSPILDEGMDAVSKNQIEEALGIFAKLDGLQSELVKEDAVASYKLSADDRLEEYYKAKESLSAIPSMWPSFDKWTGGWTEATFFVLAGFTTVGKTWSLIITALDAASKIKAGENVLIVSTEMSRARIARRLDSVKYKLDFIELRDGDLTPAREERWAMAMAEEMDSESGDIIIADSQGINSVDDILSLCYRYKPRMVLVDGGYRLRAKGTRGDWERQVRVIEEIQRATIVTNIPWVVTTQLGDGNETGKGLTKSTADRWNVRYAKEWIINPDYVLTLTQNEDSEAAMEMNWAFTKMRDAERRTASFTTHWDYKKFNYSEIEELPFEEGLGKVPF